MNIISFYLCVEGLAELKNLILSFYRLKSNTNVRLFSTLG